MLDNIWYIYFNHDNSVAHGTAMSAGWSIGWIKMAATMRFTFVVLSEISQQIVDGVP